MIEEYFDFEDLEDIDFMIFGFYGCTLLRDIGEFKKGSYLSMITLDFDSGIIRLIDKEDNEVEYFINLSFSEINRY